MVLFFKIIIWVVCFFPAAVENDDHAEDSASLEVGTKTDLLSKKRSTGLEKPEPSRGDEKSEDKKENSLSFSNTHCDSPTPQREELPKGDKPAVKGECRKTVNGLNCGVICL